MTGTEVAASRADYQIRRDSLLSPRSATPVDGLTSRRDRLAAGLSLIGVIAEIAWATIVLAQRLPAVVGWPAAVAILVVLVVAYRLISIATAARPDMA